MPAAGRDDLVVALAALLPLAFFLIREAAVAGSPGFPLDDSWIHLHFARNLADGAGFSYNPGRAVAGSTAPLWTLLLGGAALIAGATLAVTKVVGVLAGIGAAIVTRHAAVAWGAPPATALAAAVGLAWTGAMAWGALSGMEVTLAALLVAAALLAHARGVTWPTALAAALAALARPEAIVLVPLLFLADRPTCRRAAVYAAITVLVLLPSVAFSYATVGAPFPATAAAKVEGGLLGWLAGVRESALVLWVTRPADFLARWAAWLWDTHRLLVLVFPALALVWRRTGRRLAVPALAVLAHPLAMAWLAPYRDPSFQEGRYSMHLLPVAFVVLAVVTPRGDVARRVLAVAWLVLAMAALPAGAERYAWAVQNINAMQVHLGQWVDRTLPATARLAVNDIGAIAYFSRREIIDLVGLVTPEILPYKRRGDPGVIEYVRETCPDYLIVFPTWYPELTRQEWLVEAVYRVRLDRNVVSGGDEMVVYRLRRCAV